MAIWDEGSLNLSLFDPSPLLSVVIVPYCGMHSPSVELRFPLGLFYDLPPFCVYITFDLAYRPLSLLPAAPSTAHASHFLLLSLPCRRSRTLDSVTCSILISYSQLSVESMHVNNQYNAA